MGRTTVTCRSLGMVAGAILVAACTAASSTPSLTGAGGGADAGAPEDAAAPAPLDADPPDLGTPWPWQLPKGFPIPVVPPDNPMTVEKVLLGRHLFYDKRLSQSENQSCASCHVQALAFTDGRATSVGSTGVAHPRNAMSLANVAYASTLTWANPLLLQLERQALVPMFGDDPVELGLRSAAEIETRLSAIPKYVELFAAAFPGDPSPITTQHLVQALSSFERALVSGRSPFDRWQQSGDASGMSDAARRGQVLFNSEKFECFHCHVGFAMTNHVHFEGKAFFDRPYHNTGLYNVGGSGVYPAPNSGVHHVTRRPEDMGRFKAPTLRNIAVTAPYMHDGSIATLEEVLDHYAAGGRTVHAGPSAGVGSTNPFKDPIIRAFAPTPEERADVLAFLRSLTDSEFLVDPRYADPW